MACRRFLSMLSCRGPPRRRKHDSVVRASAPPVKWLEEPLDLPTEQGGGFFTASPGLELKSRYTIIRKLGRGQHSSVWLAKDSATIGHVAIKILSRHATEVQGRVSDELTYLNRIRTKATETSAPGKDHVITLLDHFELKSDYGSHLCLVTEVLGDSFKSLRERYGHQLPVPLVKEVTRQILLALAFLHADCQIIHTDIKQDNIQLRIPDLEYVLSQEDSVPLKPSHPTGEYTSRPISEISAYPDPGNIHVKLTDFGTAAAVDGYHAQVIQPAALRAPEVIVGCGWGASADVWNLGCLVFELLTGRWLFVPRSGPNWTAETYHLGCMRAMVEEEFDHSFVNTGKNAALYFTEQGTLRQPVEGASLEKALGAYKFLQDDDMLGCASFLRAMLRLNPSDRAAPLELLQHDFLVQ